MQNHATEIVTTAASRATCSLMAMPERKGKENKMDTRPEQEGGRKSKQAQKGKDPVHKVGNEELSEQESVP